MAKRRLHRGLLLKTIVQNSGLKVAVAAKKAGYSRESYYKHIAREDLSLNILLKYGKALHYDFSNDLPEMETLTLMEHTSTPTTLPQALQALETINAKYRELLEKYTAVLETLNHKRYKS